MAAEADRAVDEEAAARRLEQRQRLRDEDGRVLRGHRQIPNSDSARASSSVYGSRCMLGDEPLVVPDVERSRSGRNVDVADHPGRVAQPRMDDDAALRRRFAPSGRSS